MPRGHVRIKDIPALSARYTDHQALTGLVNQPDPTGKFARWITKLQEFPMHIHYRPGKENVVADALSRLHTTETIKAINTATQHPGFPMQHVYRYLRNLTLPSNRPLSATPTTALVIMARAPFTLISHKNSGGRPCSSIFATLSALATLAKNSKPVKRPVVR
jgi:hypothetical protein